MPRRIFAGEPLRSPVRMAVSPKFVDGDADGSRGSDAVDAQSALFDISVNGVDGHLPIAGELPHRDEGAVMGR